MKEYTSCIVLFQKKKVLRRQKSKTLEGFICTGLDEANYYPINCVATVYTSERWHIWTRTSRLCFLMRPCSARGRRGEPGCWPGVPLVAPAGVTQDKVSHLQFRGALGMCCISMAAPVGSGWHRHFSPAVPRGGLWFAALSLEAVARGG